MIRRYEPGDAAACAGVIAAAAAGMDGLNEAAHRLVASKNTPAEVDSELGAIFTVVHLDPGLVNGVGALDEREMKRLYVAPEAQGRGIGTKLCDALESEAVKRSLPLIRVEASTSSVGFYTSRGYEVAGHRELVVDDAIFQLVELRLDLDRTPEAR